MLIEAAGIKLTRNWFARSNMRAYFFQCHGYFMYSGWRLYFLERINGQLYWTLSRPPLFGLTLNEAKSDSNSILIYRKPKTADAIPFKERDLCGRMIWQNSKLWEIVWLLCFIFFCVNLTLTIAGSLPSIDRTLFAFSPVCWVILRKLEHL